MTIYIKIDEGDGSKGPPRHCEWRPWINCKPEEREMTVRLALHRWVRNRGGVQHDEVLHVTIWSFTDKDPTWPTGQPKAALTTTFKLTKD